MNIDGRLRKGTIVKGIGHFWFLEIWYWFYGCTCRENGIKNTLDFKKGVYNRIFYALMTGIAYVVAAVVGDLKDVAFIAQTLWVMIKDYFDV